MVFVVTGCSKGIGYELVKLLSLDNMVYCISRNDTAIKKLKSEVSNSKNISFFKGDVSKLDLNQISQWIKDEKVDVLINNAGVLINKPFIDQSYEDYKNTMDVNFYGVLNMTHLLVSKLEKAKGQIVNIGSVGGVQGSVKYPGLSVYSSSKGAVSILTECLAIELEEKNIKINCLALGAVQTEMLNKAFPGYKAKITAIQMAEYIINFIYNGSNLSNGLIIPVTLSNP